MARTGRGTRQIRQAAQEALGFEQLRPGQEEAIKAVLDGHDTLVVMPTGVGKSAIYQIAALLRPGPTVVVSPLIALQRDQVEALQDLEAGKAALVNSTIRTSEREAAFAAFKSEELEFLFLAPEQFENEQVLANLQAAGPSLMIIDEAHCISEWGHDFRPSYLRLGAIAEQLGHPTVLALTATASPLVQDEIIERLGMQEPRVIVKDLDRPNIWLGVERFPDEPAKQRALLEWVGEAELPGIIYVATRKRAETVTEILNAAGVPAAAYHAGLKASERDNVQAAFMNDELPVIVATTAFGMGIDKPNVRFVYHYDISGSVDAYYQEMGRAGRDGEAAEAVLFYCPNDLGIRRFFAGGSQLDEDEVTQVMALIQVAGEPVEPDQLRATAGLSQARLITILNRLEEVGAITRLPTGQVGVTEEPLEPEQAAEAAAEAQGQRHQFEQSRLAMMRSYAELQDCRRTYLLNYFGQEFEAPCGYCDNCEAGIAQAETTGQQPFPLNSRVSHEAWGEGLVIRYEGDKMFVLFDRVGYKTLAADVVVERGLLKPV